MNASTVGRPLAGHVDEARRVLDAAREAGVTLRVTGGVGRRGRRREIGALFAGLG